MDPELLDLEARWLLEAALEAPDLAGPHHERVEAGVADAMKSGGEVLLDLAGAAVGRLLAGRHRGPGLFTPDELLRLAASIEQALDAGDGLARLLLLDRLHGLARRELGVKESRVTEAVLPHSVLDYFKGLVGVLGLDPRRQGPTLARTAFTLAVATGEELLAKVQDAIADRIKSGKVASGPRAVAEVLDAAGVSPRNPQYAEAVFRTNYLDAFNQTYEDQLSESADSFPVYRYSNPHDSRSRPWHAKRNGLYFDSRIPFTRVRGTSARETINCRCLPIAIDRREWSRLQASGARVTPLSEVPRE